MLYLNLSSIFLQWLSWTPIYNEKEYTKALRMIKQTKYEKKKIELAISGEVFFSHEMLWSYELEHDHRELGQVDAAILRQSYMIMSLSSEKILLN